MRVVDLPEVIFRTIKTFVSNDDYHYFMNISKKDFGEIKRQTIYFPLNYVKSKEYVLNSGGFQVYLLTKVESGWKQIGTKFINIDFINIPRSLPIHKLDVCDDMDDYLSREAITAFDNSGSPVYLNGKISEISKFPYFAGLQELELSDRGSLSDVSNLSHLNRLVLREAIDLIDITPLHHIPCLTLECSHNVSDYSMLGSGKQKSLILYNCPSLRSLQNMRSMHHLELHNCPNVIDVSSLYGIYDLRLIKCKNVVDISSLGNHFRLAIVNCSSHLLGYGSLIHIPHITLTNCDISDLSVLQFAKSVTLKMCTKLSDFKYLEKVERIEINDCGRLPNLRPLKHVRELILVPGSSPRSIGFTICKCSNYMLDLTGICCSEFSIPKVQHLTIRNDAFFAEMLNEGRVAPFIHLQSLSIVNCKELQHVDGLGGIPTLKLINCQGLTNIGGLGRNRWVEVEGAMHLLDVSSLATVTTVIIRYCPKIQNLEALRHVPRLKVIELLKL